MQVNYGKTYVTVELQHLDYSGIIGRGYLDPAYSLKLLELVRWFGMKITRDLIIQKDEPITAFFLAWQQIEFSKHYYSLKDFFLDRRKLLQGLNRKIKLLHQTDYIGNSSQKFKNVAWDLTANEVMINGVGRLVNVDATTRRPTGFSPVVKEHYHKHRAENQPGIPLKFDEMCTDFYEIPVEASIFCQTSQIGASQVDHNGHLNQAYYVSLCFNCWGQWLESKFKEKTFLWDWKIERISCLYLKECVVGDVVDAIVWQNQSDPTIFHFHLKKKKDVICQVEFQFFQQDFVSKL